ncbi:glycogen debranching enzyme [Acrasis kona]|uniref:Glycogen debranching enzyme n=1 Tax=Acrasis kona TaxID=1008807 RepID=A0AAW2YXG2_9EUKA
MTCSSHATVDSELCGMACYNPTREVCQSPDVVVKLTSEQQNTNQLVASSNRGHSQSGANDARSIPSDASYIATSVLSIFVPLMLVFATAYLL